MSPVVSQVAAGADIKAVDRIGRSVLIGPVIARRLDIVETLLELGADPSQTNSQGMSGLSLSAMWHEGLRAFSMAELVRNLSLACGVVGVR